MRTTPKRSFKSLMLVIFCAVLCVICIPTISARKLDNNRNELHDNGTGNDSHFDSNGKTNTQFDNDSASTYYTAKRNIRSLLMTPKENTQKLHSKIPLTLDLVDFLLEYENDDRMKRFDDYGHMRFGKRGGEEQFDDYGHMRFGRSV